MNGKIINGKPIFVALAQRKDVRRAQLEAQHTQRVGINGQQNMLAQGGRPQLMNGQMGQHVMGYPGGMPYMLPSPRGPAGLVQQGPNGAYPMMMQGPNGMMGAPRGAPRGYPVMAGRGQVGYPMGAIPGAYPVGMVGGRGQAMAGRIPGGGRGGRGVGAPRVSKLFE